MAIKKKETSVKKTKKKSGEAKKNKAAGRKAPVKNATGEITKISQLIPDDKNFNIGSEYGNALIEKSFRKFGAGRSILIDKNNKIISGNKSIENAHAIGLQDVQVILSDGTKVIAVKRTDIDLNTPIGRELALADNASAKANIVWDAEVMSAVLTPATIEEWGAKPFDETKIDMDKFFEGSIDSKESMNKIVLHYSEEDHEKVMAAFEKRTGTREEIVFKLLKA